MASPIGVAAFAFRDVVKYILPTMFAYALFVPFFQQEINFDSALIASILLGYVVTLFVGNVYKWVLAKTNRTLKTMASKAKRNYARWDYRTLTVNLAKDENDALYLTDSYATLYLLFSAYFLIYALVMVWQIVHWYVLVDVPCVFEWRTVFSCALVPTAFGKDVPVPALLAASVVLFWVALKAYLKEYEVLNLVNYPSLAEKYHRKGIHLARSIWGTVTARAASENPAKPLAEVSVHLVGSSGDVLASTRTDDEGVFTLTGMLPKYMNRQLRLVLPDYPAEPPVYVYLSATDVPETHIEVKTVSLENKAEISGS